MKNCTDGKNSRTAESNVTFNRRVLSRLVYNAANNRSHADLFIASFGPSLGPAVPE